MFRMHDETVLAPDCSLAQVQQSVESLGWTWVQRIPAETAQFHEEIWLADNDRGAVRFIEDHFLDVALLRIESNSPAILDGLVKQVAPLLRSHGITALVKLSQSGDAPTRAFALRGMAAVSRRFYGDVFAALKTAVLDPDPAVRGLALRCISRYPWFQFIKVLEEAASKEAVDDLRSDQLALAEQIRKHGKRGTS